MDLAGIRAALVGWARTAAPSATVFYGEPNGPRPLPPAVRLKLIFGPDQVGVDELRDVRGSTTDFTITGSRKLTLSIMAFGDTAQQLASDLLTSLSDPATQATLDAVTLSSLSASQLRDLSALLDTKYEQRCQFDVELLASEAITVQPGVIEHVHGSGTVSNEAGAVALTATVSVDKTP